MSVMGFFLINEGLKFVKQVVVDLYVLNASFLDGFLLLGVLGRFALASKVPVERDGNLLALESAFGEEVEELAAVRVVVAEGLDELEQNGAELFVAERGEDVDSIVADDPQCALGDVFALVVCGVDGEFSGKQVQGVSKVDLLPLPQQLFDFRVGNAY